MTTSENVGGVSGYSQGPEITSEDIRTCLDQLVDIKKCVLSFDKSPIEYLTDIIAEQYGIRSDSDIPKSRPLQQIIAFFEQSLGRRVSLVELPGLLIANGFDNETFHAKLRTDSLPEVFEKWTTATARENRGRVLALQKDLAMGTYNVKKPRYESDRNVERPLKWYLSDVTTPPSTLLQRALNLSFWELKIKLWRLAGYISPKADSLSVGPRWITEIKFFRQIVGLEKHIGLDLFSDDEDLVKAGDMHNMPFEANRFNFIFIKNTMDKSYDVRKLVEELIRVALPTGIIAVDQICGHGGVSPLHRTDVQAAKNLLTLFESRVKVRTLVSEDIDVRQWSRDGASNNVRLAIQVLK